MTLIEAGIYASWIGKQTAQGTPNTAPGKRLVQVAGDVNLARDDGSEAYSDLTKYGADTDWVNSITGRGDLGLQATPTETAYLLWLMHGSEVFAAQSAVVGPPAVPAVSRHTFTPTLSKGYWSTIFTRVGNNNVRRHQQNDCLITKIVLEASSANKAMRVTPSIISLDPAQTFAADPAASLPAERPFLHTDLSQIGSAAAPTVDGALSIDGTVFRTVNTARLEIDDAWEPVYGDDSRPCDFQQGSPSVSVGATILFDAAGLGQWNRLVYGTTSPAAGTKPVRGIPALGSMQSVYRQRNADGSSNGLKLDWTVPGVKWQIPDAPAPNPAGGLVEVPLVGSMRPIAGVPAYTIVTDLPTGTVAFTV